MINKNTVNFGLLIGGISIVYFLLTIVIEPGWMLNMVLLLIYFVLVIWLLVRFLKGERRLNEGIISFKEAFVKGFVGLVIGSVISSIIMIVYVQVIDTGYADRVTMQTMKSTAKFMEGNVPDEKMQEVLTKIEHDMGESFTLVGQIKTFGKGLIAYAIICLIVAAVVKRKPQLTDENTLDAGI